MCIRWWQEKSDGGEKRSVIIGMCILWLKRATEHGGNGRRFNALASSRTLTPLWSVVLSFAGHLQRSANLVRRRTHLDQRTRVHAPAHWHSFLIISLLICGI